MLLPTTKDLTTAIFATDERASLLNHTSNCFIALAIDLMISASKKMIKKN
jgi:hypothetical protein